MNDVPSTRSGFQMVREVWSRRKWLGLLVFVFPFAAGTSLLVFLPSVYQSNVTLLVERQQVPEAFVRSTVTSALETRLQTISQEILSRSRLEGLITRFNLYADLRSRVPAEEVIERMRADIQLRVIDARVRGKVADATTPTVAFALSFRGSDPQTVALVTNTLGSFYIEENLKVRERQATGTAEFLKAQLGETKKRLDEQERRVSEYQKRNLGELPQQMQSNLSTLERLSFQLTLNTERQNRATERRQLLARQLAEASAYAPSLPGLPGSSGPAPAAVRLARLKQEMAELRTRFSDKYPDVIRLKGEIEVAEREAAEAKTASPTQAAPPTDLGPEASPYLRQLRQALTEAEVDVKVLKAEERDLRGSIATYQRRVDNTPQRDQEFKELTRDYETTRDHYSTLLKRYEEAQLAESMEQRQKGEQFRVVDPAIPADQPAVPKRARLFGVALALSVGLALGAVMLAEHLDTAFHTLDELRAFTAVPVLCTIPRIVTTRDAERRRWRFRFTALAALVGLLLIVGGSYWLARGNEQLVGLLARGDS
jgi:polysaccharide chain length determinant protein (PEP-CTERM system associated)